MALLFFIVALCGAPIFAAGCCLVHFGHPFLGAVLVVYSILKSND